MLAGVINPKYKGKIGFLLYNGSKEEYVWNTEDPLGHLSVLSNPAVKVNGKLYLNPGPSGMEVWVTPSPKES